MNMVGDRLATQVRGAHHMHSRPHDADAGADANNTFALMRALHYLSKHAHFTLESASTVTFRDKTKENKLEE